MITAKGTEKARRTQRIVMCGSALSVPSSRHQQLKKTEKGYTQINLSMTKMEQMRNHEGHEDHEGC
ncbi:MAG: hypothetical protein B6245_17665 [Desulfobacteraceae bacterium 4572_88]|nr:MAG: hypothetical protein B6245_17665 [Desulfobacteraceae bacterium 4572_88]